MATDGSARIAEIRSLDLEALRPTIERVVRLAKVLADAPVAYVTLVDDTEVWHSDVPGQPEGLFSYFTSTSREIVESGRPTWIFDFAAEKPQHPWVVAEPFQRFYAATPIRLSDGLIVGTVCVSGQEPRWHDVEAMARLADLAALLADDIERARAERAASKAKAEARAAGALTEALIRSAPLALATADRDLRFVQVNDRWCQDTGVSREAALGRPLPELFPETHAVLAEVYQRALAGEVIWGERVRVVSPNGREHWARAEVAPWRDADGAIIGLLMISHDISDMVASLQRAEHSERRLQMALEIADVLVYEVDFKAETLQLDGAQDTFFDGAVTFETLANDVWSTVHPDDRGPAMALWEQRAREGLPFRTEYRMVNPSGPGEPLWAFSAAELIVGEDGRAERLLGTLKNITERRRAEETVAAARDSAEAANRAKSEFLANMSHEIRTPLNGVMGVASALARTPLSGPQTEMVGLIETSAQTLETLLSDVLDLARIESGRLELKPEPFDLEACVRSVAALFEAGARAKGLDFDVAVAASGAFVGDAPRIRQILSNLFSNAAKFTSEGGLSLQADARDLGDDGQARLTISVTDTGIGFDAETKARLFERFEQADGSITRRYGGTGLGLAISRSLAQAMGGTLTADSTEGQGSTFTLVLDLPRSAAASAMAAEAATAGGVIEVQEGLSRPGGRALRVLLAEDHAVNRRVVELILGAAGAQMTCVENGALAVEAAARESFDLVLMDMQMPVMDGLTAIRAIRAAGNAVPIHALSANAMPEHVAASLAAGADGHLTKPIAAHALLAVATEAGRKQTVPPQALQA
jgi:PAS domain S-box-containing protein